MALSTAALNALSTGQFNVFSSSQIAALSTQQVVALELTDFAALGAGQIVALSTANMAVLSTAQVVALTSVQVVALTSRQLVALGTQSIASLETRDLALLDGTQIAALGTAQVRALLCGQTAALTTGQITSLSTAQIAALNTVAVYLDTPIMLDLNGDGVQTLGLNAGVRFDVRANGLPMQTGWVSAQDGLLVMDRNGDGSINDGSELFGSSTLLPDGTLAQDGYQALTALDENSDGMISSKDTVFGQLRLWVDANSDGLSAPDELRTLDSLSIASISTQAFASSELNNGNLLGLVSSYQTTDGQSHQAADVWFGALAEDVVPNAERVNTLTQAIGEFFQTQAAPINQKLATPATTQPAANSMLALSQTLVAELRSYQCQVQSQQAITCCNTSPNSPANFAAMAAPLENSKRLGGECFSPSDPQKAYQLVDLR